MWYRHASLRRKIIIGYLVINVVFLALLVFLYVGLHRMHDTIDASEQTSQLMNSILEMRRYEKNFFLYHQQADLVTHATWAEQTWHNMGGHEEHVATLLSPEAAQDMRQLLIDYRAAMQDYAARDAIPVHADRVRQYGKQLVTHAEHLVARERMVVLDALAWFRYLVLLSVLLLLVTGIVAGRRLLRTVIRPLQEMERTMARVADGDLYGAWAQVRSEFLPSGHTVGGTSAPNQELQLLALAFNRMLEEIRIQQEQLVQSKKLSALGTMLAGVAHELNNPLSNIATSCQILLEEPDLAPFHRDMLLQVDDQTVRTRKIVRTLLDFSRNRMPSWERIELRPLAMDTVELLRSQIPESVRVLVDVPEGFEVWADRQQLHQLLLNLLKNGADALQGETTLRHEVHLKAFLPGHVEPEWIPAPDRLLVGQPSVCNRHPGPLIVVQDTGCGMAPDVLHQSVDPFFTTKEIGFGSGLGLFVIHEIVAHHGGCMMVESTPGNGTRCHVWLPGVPWQHSAAEVEGGPTI